MAAHRVFVSARAAVVELWGQDGLRRVREHLPREAHGLVDSAIVSDAWLPERLVVQWFEAVWRGPAQQNEEAFAGWVRKTIDSGFGRVRRLLIKLATPPTLCERTAELWSDEHTHGVLTAQPDGHDVYVRLSEHPYVLHARARVMIAEAMRYAASLTRVKSVVGSHRVIDNETFELKLTWT